MVSRLAPYGSGAAVSSSECRMRDGREFRQSIRWSDFRLREIGGPAIATEAALQVIRLHQR